MSRLQEYDLYLNPQKPAVGLYARKGAGLPELADPKKWVLDGAGAQGELPPGLVRSIEDVVGCRRIISRPVLGGLHQQY
jgi:hypothetical protein